MNELRLEDRLRDLAGDVAAPATDDVRHSVGRRAGRLRHRRQVRRIGAAGVLAVFTIAGVAAVRHDPKDVEVGPADDGTSQSGDRIAGFTVDLPGWQVTNAGELPDSLQVFRVPDQPDGPLVVLQASTASDPVLVGSDEQEVQIGAATGGASVDDSGRVKVRWNPGNGDSEAELQALGLSQDEAVEFARRLTPRAGAVQFPGSGDLDLGFDGADLPDGLVEVPAASDAEPRLRFVQLEREGTLASIDLDQRGGRDWSVGEVLPPKGDAEQVMVRGHQGALVHDPVGQIWTASWVEDDQTAVTFSVSGTGVDHDLVTDMLGHLRLLSEQEWADLVAAHPTSTTLEAGSGEAGP